MNMFNNSISLSSEVLDYYWKVKDYIVMKPIMLTLRGISYRNLNLAFVICE